MIGQLGRIATALILGATISTTLIAASEPAMAGVSHAAQVAPRAPYGECGSHVQIVAAQRVDGTTISFRVTANSLGDYLGAGGAGNTFATVYDDNGSEPYGPYGASADTGSNFQLYAAHNTDGSSAVQVTVEITNYDNTATLCSSTYTVPPV